MRTEAVVRLPRVSGTRTRCPPTNPSLLWNASVVRSTPSQSRCRVRKKQATRSRPNRHGEPGRCARERTDRQPLPARRQHHRLQVVDRRVDAEASRTATRDHARADAVGMLSYSATSARSIEASVEAAAQALGIRIIGVTTDTPEEVEPAYRAIAAQGGRAVVLVMGNPEPGSARASRRRSERHQLDAGPVLDRLRSTRQTESEPAARKICVRPCRHRRTW